MKKTTQKPRRRVPPVALIPTPDPKAAKAAARDGMMRVFSADWTDALWEDRDAVGKMGRVADGVGARLGGLAEFCHSLAWADLTKSGRKSGDDALPPGYEAHRYLAQALGDLSEALKAARAAWWETINADYQARRQRPEPARQRRAGV